MMIAQLIGPLEPGQMTGLADGWPVWRRGSGSATVGLYQGRVIRSSSPCTTRVGQLIWAAGRGSRA